LPPNDLIIVRNPPNDLIFVRNHGDDEEDEGDIKRA
jgi:hypothetical protein